MWPDEDMTKDTSALLFDALSEDDDELEELDLSDFDAPCSLPPRQ